MKSTAKITLFIFWLGFFSFLATSVPHVAWLYRQYEPSNMLIWDVLSYAIAVSIDVLIAWLSYVQTEANKKKSAVVITWLFIAALCAISYYANYIYDIAHNPTLSIDVWSIHLFDSPVTVASCTPVIVSALPVFVIAYTFMLNVVRNTKSETLEEKATRLENDRAARDRIREATKGQFTSVLTGMIDGLSEVASHVQLPAKDMQQVTLLSTGEIATSVTLPETPETPVQHTEVTLPASTHQTVSEVSQQSSEVTRDTDRLVAITPLSSGHTPEIVTDMPRYVPRARRTS